MPFIDGIESPLKKELYYDGTVARSPELAIKYNDKESEYNRNSLKALGAIKSIISMDLVEMTKD